MKEDIIELVIQDLLKYKREMFKAGKSLEKKANITKHLAEGLYSFFEGELSERKKSVTVSEQHDSKALHIANVSGSHCMYCEKELKPNEAIIICKDCAK